MSDKMRMIQLKPLLPLSVLALAIIGIWFAYTAALPGYFLFDDEINLQGLQTVRDFKSAFIFTFSGENVLGRPLSLATFAAQAQAWPDRPDLFLRVNFAIHLLAVAACFLLAVGLVLLRGAAHLNKTLWIGVGVAALWGFSPFLATTHLMIIQRMTSLAGLLTLTGLTAFAWAHLFAANQSIKLARGLLILTGLMILLATLAKENGALLPLLALVIIWLWIPKQHRLTERPERILLFVFIILPSLFLAIYLSHLFIIILDHGYSAQRYFTLDQRLMSQPTILLDYLRNLFLPQAFSVTPFMDHIPAPQGWLQPPLTLLAMLFWVFLLVFAFWWRRVAPVVLFGILFFLTGHLLESTFIGLELYFAHRNYVPAFGLYFALVYSLAYVPKRFSGLAVFFFSAYLGLFAFVLFQVTYGWHQVHIATRFWLEKNPYSERAVQVFANQRITQGEPTEARRAFDHAAALSPEIAILQIQRTQFCWGEEDQFPVLLQEVKEHLRTAAFHQVAAVELFKAAYGNPTASCAPRDYSALSVLAQALLDNPAYAESDFAKGYLLATEGLVALNRDEDLARAIALFEQAFHTFPAQDFATYGALLMANADQFERAYAFLEDAREQLPKHPFKRMAQLRYYADVQQKIEAAQRIKEQTSEVAR
ncbi:tetratricopeptide repeat protein [Allochromatium tepidum]|uniref:Tetratricopeptide repeat protein n=1 Tax=Allochromatium tepidum TaxID=553982 RepID=A0ABM7QI53_9GAMM|nr:tetratricopeptide repeat protein [Allochromatium tepidum]BCU05452.1 hypothetical protein Atep_01290 [Allochromatium tepidum]